MRAMELFQFAHPVIYHGMAAIALDRRAFKALKEDIESTRISVGIHPGEDWMTPKDSMRYNGVLYVIEE